MIRAVHKTGSGVPLLHATCKQIVTSEAVGVLSAHKQILGLPCILTDHYTSLRRKEMNEACQCACPDGIAPSKMNT